MKNIIELFLINTLSYFIFFIGVPYWTGEELSELYPKPVYKCLFSIFMEIGHMVYRLVETIISAICEGLMSHSRLLSGLLTIGVYSALLYFASGYYESVVTAATPVVNEVMTDTSKYAKLSDLLFIKQLWSMTAGVGLVSRLFDTLRYLIAFSFANLVYFGIVYGFLQYKVMELNLIHPISAIVESIDNKLSDLSDDADANAFDSAIREIKVAGLRVIQCPLEFISRFRILNACLLGGAGFILLLIIFAYTLWSVFTKGVTADWHEFMINVLDNLDIMNIIFSLIITLIEMFIINIICSTVYSVLPAGAKGVIDSVVGACSALDDKLRDGRANFASNHDYSYQESGDTGPTLHRMEF